MGFNLKYVRFCTVNIWQGYYFHPVSELGNVFSAESQNIFLANVNLLSTYDISNDIVILPTKDTQTILNRNKIIFKPSTTGFNLWIRAEEQRDGAYSPAIPLDSNLKLTFYAKVVNPYFWNFSNIAISNFQNWHYYFSNRTGSPYLNLEAEVPLEVLYLNRSRDATEISTYVTEADQVRSQSTLFEVNVERFRQQYIRFVWQNAFQQFEFTCTLTEGESILSVCRFYLHDLPSGLYQVSAFSLSGDLITELNQSVYFNRGDIPKDVLGVIEIFHLSSSDLGRYALIDEAQRLRSPYYTLWWQNRLTHWRYLFASNQDAPSADCDVSFETTDNQRQLVTKELQPLLNRYRAVRFRGALTSAEDVLLPNPDTNSIYPEATGIFSEVYMGNILLTAS